MSPFGRYERVEKLEGSSLSLSESLEVKMARIPPEQYRAFGEFLAAVDRAQTREWVLEPVGAAPFLAPAQPPLPPAQAPAEAPR